MESVQKLCSYYVSKEQNYVYVCKALGQKQKNINLKASSKINFFSQQIMTLFVEIVEISITKVSLIDLFLLKVLDLEELHVLDDTN